MSSTPGVTVVVPIYGDLESLLECVRSLKSTVDFSRHHVLLVNDVGPDADVIEEAMLREIEGLDGFEYHRNPHNLGFVGTCNRAALELDQSDRDILLLNSDTVATDGFVDAMEAVLYADERHGVVTARSNSATIASIPYRLADPASARTFERTQAVYDTITPFLPASTVVPVAMGFCFLTRRELIRKYGLFAQEFAPGYGEENDYCLRINKAGYLSVMANTALVFHEGSKSFVSVGRNEIRDAHEKLLDSKYPYYRRAVRYYNYFGVRAAEWFADVIVPRDGRPKAEIELRGLSDALPQAGQRFEALARIRTQLLEPLLERFDVQIVADPDDAVALGVDPSRARIVNATPDPVEIFDVGVVIADGVHGQRLVEANRRHLRTVGVSVLDPAPIAWSREVGAGESRVAADELHAFADWWIELGGGRRDLSRERPSLSGAAPELLPGPVPDGGAVVDEIESVVRAGAPDLAAFLERLERRWAHFTAVELYLDRQRRTASQ